MRLLDVLMYKKKIRKIKPSILIFLLLHLPLFIVKLLDGNHCHTFLAELEM